MYTSKPVFTIGWRPHWCLLTVWSLWGNPELARCLKKGLDGLMDTSNSSTTSWWAVVALRGLVEHSEGSSDQKKINYSLPIPFYVCILLFLFHFSIISTINLVWRRTLLPPPPFSSFFFLLPIYHPICIWPMEDCWMSSSVDEKKFNVICEYVFLLISNVQ